MKLRVAKSTVYTAKTIFTSSCDFRLETAWSINKNIPGDFLTADFSTKDDLAVKSNIHASI